MDHLAMKPLQPGLVNLPGATPASKSLVHKLLRKDLEEHHCFWNGQYFTNHLSHHVLSLHDLGAPEELIQAMYDKEAAIQRPLHLDGAATATVDPVTEENWTSKLGNDYSHMYPHYVAFFSAEIAKLGVADALERYLFSPEANGNGTLMLARFTSRLLHPLIQAGFGIEFDQDFMVAQGTHGYSGISSLAQAAVCFPDAANMMDAPACVPEIKTGPETTLLALLRELYDTPQLAPLPYEGPSTDANRFVQWMTMDHERDGALRALYAKWTFHPQGSDAYFAQKVDECLWQAALLLGATGRAGRPPRMDFFLMHFLTGALFLPRLVHAIRQPAHRAQLLQAYARMAGLFVILRGRPRIDGTLVMGFPAFPAPPRALAAAQTKTRGGSAWLGVLENAGAHPEAHVIKAIRMLFYSAQRLGATPAGGVPGAVDADGAEMHKGMRGVDGTLFIRVSGALLSGLGWVADGDKERFWDLSGVGWEEAWVGGHT